VLLHKRKKEKRRRGPPLEANHSSSHRWGIYIYIFLFLYIFPIFCWATGRPVAYRRGYTSTHTASTAHSTYNIVHLSHSFLFFFFLLFGWPQTTFLHSLAAGQQEGGNITRTGPASQRRGALGSQQDASTSFSSSFSFYIFH
jgi:hypothetical protein